MRFTNNYNGIIGISLENVDCFWKICIESVKIRLGLRKEAGFPWIYSQLFLIRTLFSTIS